jgi:plasmid stability protein
MCQTCDHVDYMARMIQIRNVPEDLHRRLKVRAAQEGMTLSDYLLREVADAADRPSVGELARRIAARDPAGIDAKTAAALVRADRDRR